MATVHAVFHTVLLLTMPNCLLNLLHASGAEQDLYLQWPVTLEGQERQHQQSSLIEFCLLPNRPRQMLFFTFCQRIYSVWSVLIRVLINVLVVAENPR